MKKLLPIILLAIAIRVIIPWHEIFGGEYIKFACPDSYYFINLAVTGSNERLWSVFLRAPSWIITLGHPTKDLIEHTAIFLPPLMAGGIVFFVYLIGKNMFNERAGLLSALVVAIIPGEFYGRSILGACDHHIAEVFFTTGAMAFITLGERRNKLLYGALAFGFVLIYRAIWPGYWLFIGPLGLYAIYKIWHLAGKWRLISYAGAAVGIFMLWQFNVLDNVFNYPSRVLDETIEAHSAFSLIGISGFYLPKCLLTIGFLYFARKNAQILIWGLVIVGATLWQVRFDYYLAIPLSLSFGIVLSKLYDRIKTSLTKQSAKIVTSTMLLAFSMICMSWYLSYDIGKYTPRNDLIRSSEWLRDNTPSDSVIVSWWDYGYWIEYYSEREAMVDNGQNSEGIETANKILNGEYGLMSYEYLLIDDRMVEGNYMGMPEVDLSDKVGVYSDGVKIYVQK